MNSSKKRLLLFINTILVFSFATIFYACSNNSNSNNSNSSKSKTIINKDNVSDNNYKSLSKISSPFAIYGSKYSFMKILIYDKKYQTELQKRANYLPDININILFYDLSNEYYKLLFNNPVKIISIDYPSTDKEKNQKYILYKVNVPDSNGSNDNNNILFISDVNGNDLTQITDAKLNLVSYSKINNNRLLIIESIPNKEVTKENWQSKVIIYDMNSKKIIENKFDLMLEKAIKIFNKKGV